ncbi:MAG: alpha/beta hydrolase domain-containing protein [Janthinobacterium lividum]
MVKNWTLLMNLFKGRASHALAGAASLAFATGLMGGVSHAATASVTAIPTVTAIPSGGAYGHAANAIAYATVPFNPGNFGYLEQEYKVSGTANVYGYATTSPSNDSVTVLRSGPYVSRMIIRGPANPAKFSGNVIVELFNDAFAGDQSTAFPQAEAHIIRNGDVWVGITSTATGIADLKAFNPTRYASLSWANPDASRNATSCPVAPTSTVEDGFVYDIVSQTAAFLRSTAPSNPLNGYKVKAIYAAGYSGSAESLLTYVRAIEPTLATAPFDGYMITAGAARAPLNECSPASEETSHNLVPASTRAAVMQVQTPSEVAVYLAANKTAFPHQADSDAATNRYRFYEIAGSSHVDQTLVNGAPNLTDQKAIFGTTINTITAGCKQAGKVSTFPDLYVYDNLWAKLEGWVTAGTAPPHATEITGVDKLGNVAGGVRSPAVDVPTAIYVPGSVSPLYSVVGAVTLPCPFLGYEVDLNLAQLTAVYGNKPTYVNYVSYDASNLYAQGFLELADAQAIIAAAEAAPLPTH